MVQGEWRALIRQPPTRLPVFLLALFLLDYFSCLSQVRSLALQHLDQNAIAAIQSPHSTQRTSRLSIPLLYLLRMRLNLAEGNFLLFFGCKVSELPCRRRKEKQAPEDHFADFQELVSLLYNRRNSVSVSVCICFYFCLSSHTRLKSSKKCSNLGKTKQEKCKIRTNKISSIILRLDTWL
jgi:hypothetical protein